jgi:predicted RNase H-like HicB family nuclease
MKSLGVLQSNTGTPSVSVWSDAVLTTSASIVRSKSEDVFLLTVPSRTLLISSNNIGALWRTSDRGYCCQWLRVGSSMRLRPSPAIDGPSREARSPATDLVPTAGSATPEPSAKPSRAERIELAIDSLPNYEVLKPIPVLIESLGDKVFVAEAPDLNLSTSGNSVGAAFLMLKEHIAATYEGYRSRKGVDPERARQLALMDKYIVKTKRHWF